MNGFLGYRGWALSAAPLVAILVSGCDSGPVSAPGAPRAPWESLALFTFSGPDTLRIFPDATLELGADERAGSGLVSPSEFEALAEAVARADLEPLSSWPPGAQGGVLLAVGGRSLGFAWGPDLEPPAARLELRLLLERLRAEALGEGSEKVAQLATTSFARGRQALVAAPTARLIADRDGLEALLAGELSGEPLLIGEIDFAREMLLAVFAGPAVRPGAHVEIGAQVARTAGGYLLVPVTLHEPGPACAGPGRESPFHIVRLARLDTQIYFQWERLETACPGGDGWVL